MNTKNIYRLLTGSLLVVAFFFSTCSLDEDPVIYRSASNYYKDKSECETAVKGMYAAAQWIYKANFLEMVELPTDYARTTKTGEAKNSGLALYQWTPQHASVFGFYRDAFAAINRFNNTIENLERASFLSDGDRNRMLGEAYFLRALHYLDLVRVFGEHPVKVTETLDSKTKSYPKWKNEDIFKQVILPDLTFAEKYLPFNAFEPHRASGVAAKALLARTYQWLASCGTNNVMYHEWVSNQGLVTAYNDSVKKKCEEIINSTSTVKYGLYDSYYDVWLYENKLSKSTVVEHIFSINFEYENGEGNPYGAWFHNYYNNAPGWDLTPGRAPVCLGQGYDGMAPSMELWNAIHSNPFDKRDTTMFTLRHGNTTTKDQFIAAGGPANPNLSLNAATGGNSNLNSGVNFGIVKYRFQKGLESQASGSALIPIVRYSDVLLMYAEACGVNDANGRAAFEKVRRRAYEYPTYSIAADDPQDAVSEGAYLSAILTERKIELCFEMSRWFDLVRTHRLGETIRGVTMSYNTTNGVQNLNMALYFDDENKRMFFPLPSRVIDLNEGLEQNAPWK